MRQNLLDGAGVIGRHGVLHLHGFENNDFLTRFYRIADLHLEFDDAAGQRRRNGIARNGGRNTLLGLLLLGLIFFYLKLKVKS